MTDLFYNDLSFVTGAASGSNIDEFSTEDRENQAREKEIYHHRTDWLISSIAWSNDLLTNQNLNLAICSSIEDYSNQVQLVSLSRNSSNNELHDECSFEHPYPATKALFSPSNLTQQLSSSQNLTQLFATTADYLRIWKVNKPSINYDTAEQSEEFCPANRQTSVNLESVLINNKISKYCAPLTSFDWNEVDPSMIITCSVDTLCTLWDIEYQKSTTEIPAPQGSSCQDLIPSNDETKVSINGIVKTQVVAHEREVYDVSFSSLGSRKDVFVSSGADGTVRMFDLRHLKRSTVLYEIPHVLNQNVRENSIARISCNKQNPNYVSAFAFNSSELKIIDIRNPGRPAANLTVNDENITCMSWAPHSAYHISTGTSMRRALIWDLLKLPSRIENPMLAYSAAGQLNAINWSPTHQEWVAVAYRNCLELLRV